MAGVPQCGKWWHKVSTSASRWWRRWKAAGVVIKVKGGEEWQQHQFGRPSLTTKVGRHGGWTEELVVWLDRGGCSLEGDVEFVAEHLLWWPESSVKGGEKPLSESGKLLKFLQV